MSFTYTQNIPLDTNSPAEDQPGMKDNTNSVYSILNVDLYTFDSATAGKHQQVTIPARNTPGAQTDPAVVAYTAAGSASTVSDLILKNQNGAFLLSCVRAFGVFNTTSTAGAVSLLNGYNVSTIVSSNGGLTYTITLPTNACTGSNACVLVRATRNGGTAIENVAAWSLTAPTLTINLADAVTTFTYVVSFAVLQA